MARRTYTDDERAAALEMAGDRGISAAASELGIPQSTLSTWFRSARASLGDNGPSVGVVTDASLAKGALETHPLIRADVRRVNQALFNALRGRPRLLQDLYDDMRDRDDRVDTVCRTRILALVGRSWVVKPPEWAKDDPKAQKLAVKVASKLSAIRAGGHVIKQPGGGGWGTVIANIADGIVRGYSVNENEWGVDREGWRVPIRIHWRHPNRFIFDDDLYLAKQDRGDPYNGIPLTEFGPDKFVVHSPSAGRAAYPMRRGVMLGMVLPSLAKRAVTKFWLKGAERWGSPVPVAEIESKAEPGDDLKKDMLKMLRRLSIDSHGFFWGGVKIKSLEGSGKLTPDVYQNLMKEMNVAIATIGLGQNLSTEVSGGSFAATAVHDRVRGDLHDADATELDDTITQQVIRPIAKYNAPGVPAPVYHTVVQRRALITEAAVGMGIYSHDEFREQGGHPPKPDGTGALPVTVQVPDTLETPEEPTETGELSVANEENEQASVAPAPEAEPVDTAPESTEEVTEAADLAFNGTQVAALQGIILQVVAGQIPKATAAAMLALAFPLSEAEATELLDTIPPGFSGSAAPPLPT